MMVTTPNSPPLPLFMVSACYLATILSVNASHLKRRANVLNPGHFFCSDEIMGFEDSKECGEPCPSGFDMDCPYGKHCYGPLPYCEKIVSSKFCGTTLADASFKCNRECATGRDRECDADAGERCWDGSSCTLEIMSENRKEVPNPANYFCGTSFSDALTQCDTTYYALPCPPATDEHGTQKQIYGCPMGQFCYGNLKCNPVAVKPGEEWKLTTEKPTPKPSIAKPSTPKPTGVPTVYSNPNSNYCSSEWRDVNYDGVCGKPCATGLDGDCPSGQFCFIQPKCIDEYQSVPDKPPTASSLQSNPPPDPSAAPSTQNNPPSHPPTKRPTRQPVKVVTYSPIQSPTPSPSKKPSRSPSKFPTPLPSEPPPTSHQPTVTVEQIVTPSNNENDNINNNPAIMTDLTNDVYLHGKLRSSYYCGWSWDLIVNTCNMATACPTGLNTDCPTGQSCFPDTPCASIQTPPPTPKPTPRPVAPKPTKFPTKEPTFLPVEGDDPAKQFCGHDWADVIENCLTAVPCPDGYAQGVCPNGMNCIVETPCANETYLDWLKDKQANNVSGQAFIESKPSPPTTTAANNSNNNNNSNRCSSNRDCQTGQFCSHTGYCGECLSDGTGCSTEEVCRTAGCHSQGEPGVAKCYKRSELDQDCAALYQNPEGNNYFCGPRFTEITRKCLQSKPCPGGFASSFCADNLGCFSVPSCAAQYAAPPKQLTNPRTRNPTNPPSRNPTWNPTSKPTMMPTPSDPVASTIISSSTNKSSFSPTLKPIQQPTLPPSSKPVEQPELAKNPVACDLCDTGIDGPWHDIREDVNVEFGGDAISCDDLSNTISARFEHSSAQCTHIKNTHFEPCCFQKCSLCGDSNLDWEATVLFSGEEVLCHNLDSKIFMEEKISSDSSRCEMSQSIYKMCCIQAPEKPCTLCSSNGIHFNMNNNVRVSYVGEVKTCLEVYHSLYSREHSSEHCTDAQGELFDQCCEAISSQTNPTTTTDGVPSSPTTAPTTNKPTPEFVSWYTTILSSSPASTHLVSIGPFCFTIVVGLMVMMRI